MLMLLAAYNYANTLNHTHIECGNIPCVHDKIKNMKCLF